MAFIAEKAPAAASGRLGGPGLSGRPELLVMVGAIPCWTLLYEINNAPRALRFRMAGRATALERVADSTLALSAVWIVTPGWEETKWQPRTPKRLES